MNQENIIFGGRLGEYKYYDMDAVIAAALDMCEKELQSYYYERNTRKRMLWIQH